MYSILLILGKQDPGKHEAKEKAKTIGKQGEAEISGEIMLEDTIFVIHILKFISCVFVSLLPMKNVLLVRRGKGA